MKNDVLTCGCDEPTKISIYEANVFLTQVGGKYEIVQGKYSAHSHVKVTSKRGITEGYNLAVAVQRHMSLYGIES